MVFFVDTARSGHVADMPKDTDALLKWAKANPGQFSYPAPPDFIGSSFLKQVLIEQTTIMRGGSPAYLVYGSILVVYFTLCTLISAIGGRIERHFLRPYASGAEVGAKAHAIEATIPTSA